MGLGASNAGTGTAIQNVQPPTEPGKVSSSSFSGISPSSISLQGPITQERSRGSLISGRPLGRLSPAPTPTNAQVGRPGAGAADQSASGP